MNQVFVCATIFIYFLMASSCKPRHGAIEQESEAKGLFSDWGAPTKSNSQKFGNLTVDLDFWILSESEPGEITTTSGPRGQVDGDARYKVRVENENKSIVFEEIYKNRAEIDFEFGFSKDHRFFSIIPTYFYSAESTSLYVYKYSEGTFSSGYKELFHEGGKISTFSDTRVKVEDVKWNPDLTKIAYFKMDYEGDNDNPISVWIFNTALEKSHKIDSGSTSYVSCGGRIFWSSNSKYLAVENQSDRYMRVFDIEKSKKIFDQKWKYDEKMPEFKKVTDEGKLVSQ